MFHRTRATDALNREQAKIEKAARQGNSLWGKKWGECVKRKAKNLEMLSTNLDRNSEKSHLLGSGDTPGQQSTFPTWDGDQPSPTWPQALAQ